MRFASAHPATLLPATGLCLIFLLACAGSSTTSTDQAPVFTTQPLSQTVSAGASVTLTVAATGSPTPTYQWQSSTDGTTWNAISGATSASYTWTSAIGQSGYQYQAVATNSAGTATSSAATITVNAAVAAYDVVIIPPTYHWGSGELTGNAAAMDVNDGGVVVGYVEADPDGRTLPFFWTASGGVEMFALPTNDDGVANAVNNAGLIVGAYAPVSSSTSTLFSAHAGSTAIADVAKPQGTLAPSVLTVTASGQIVVSATQYDTSNDIVNALYVLESGAFTNIGLGAYNALIAYGKSGYVYGYDYTADFTYVDSFEWNGTKTTQVTSKWYSAYTGTRAVGPAGEILTTDATTGHAVIVRLGGITTDLGFSGSPKAMNASGTVVGVTDSVPWLWTSAGGKVDLNSKIDASLGLTLTWAQGINASGMIIGGATSSIDPYKTVTGLAVVLVPKN